MFECRLFYFCWLVFEIFDFEKADDDLFERINTNSRHVLYQFLPPKTAHSYNTRPRHHNFSLIEQSTDLNHRDFFIRMLYKYAY